MRSLHFPQQLTQLRFDFRRLILQDHTNNHCRQNFSHLVQNATMQFDVGQQLKLQLC